MNTAGVVLSAAKFIGRELIGDFFSWPIWWYSTGLVRLVRRRWQALVAFEASIGLTVWVINWTRPMFAQYDLTGKMISVFMRTVLIGLKTIQVMLYGLLELVGIVAWVLLPLVAGWGVWHWLTVGGI